MVLKGDGERCILGVDLEVFMEEIEVGGEACKSRVDESSLIHVSGIHGALTAC